MSWQASTRRREDHWLLWALVGFSLPVIYLSAAGVLYVVVWAFAGTRTLGILGEPSLKWIASVLASPEWLGAFAFSATLAIAASTIGLFVVVLVGYWSKFSGRLYERIALVLCLLPLLSPVVVYAIAVQYSAGRIGLHPVVTLLLANTALVVPIQYLVVRAGQGRLPASQMWAAATLGASPFVAIRAVYVPVLLPTLGVAWGFGALAVFDELVVATAVWNKPLLFDMPIQPLARRLWSLVDRQSDPIPGAVSVLAGAGVCGLGALLWGSMILLRRRRK